MRKFCNQVSIASAHDQLLKDLQDTFSSFLNYGHLRGSVKHSLDPVSLTMKAVKYFTCNVASAPMWKKIENMELCPPIKEKVISSDDLKYLIEMYGLMYTPELIEHVDRCVVYADRAFSGCLNFSSNKVSNSAVLALWGEHQSIVCGEIEYIMESMVDLKASSCAEKERVKHIIACVKWYEKHSLNTKLGFPCLIYSQDFKVFNCHSFIPLARISSRCALPSTKYDIL